jgi:hypothetical protein
MAHKKKALLTKAQLDVLYECWKEGNDTKERLILIEQRMPKVPTPKALKVMRKMAKSDAKWLKWSTRQSNLKEKEKLNKENEKNRNKEEKERKRKERELKKAEKEDKKQERVQKQIQKSQKAQISKHIESSLAGELEKHIDVSFFFCPDVHQFVNNISCIFRVFSDDVSFCNACDKCKRMDKYITILKEVTDGRSAKDLKKQRSKRDSSGARRSKNEVKESGTSKDKTPRVKSNTECSTTTEHNSRKSGTANRRGS